MIGIWEAYIEGVMYPEVSLFMVFMAKYMAVLGGGVSRCVAVCFGGRSVVPVSY